MAEPGTFLPLQETPFAKRLAGARDIAGRAAVAERFLGSDQAVAPETLPAAAAITQALAELAGDTNATLSAVRDRVPELTALQASGSLPPLLARLSDTLLAAHFAVEGQPPRLGRLLDLYRVYHLPAGTGETQPLRKFLARPLLSPVHRRGSEPPPAPPLAAPAPPPAPDANIGAAIGELLRLDRADNLVQPEAASANATLFALSDAGRRLLSAPTREILRSHGIDPTRVPIHLAVERLAETRASLPLTRLRWPTRTVLQAPGATLPPFAGKALVRASGVAELLVVKQQIKRYEGSEIAHVENVLAGEKKSRAHRQLERSEESFLTETEQSRTRETELTTVDRFELNRETSRTVKNDQKIGFGLTLSGKYGPAVEMTSQLSIDSAHSSEETSRAAATYAKDVTARSLERITERVREVRTRTIIRETEETNLHEIGNKTGGNVAGVYQFLDKVYEAQVFNYGLRQMFDFMVPEPASFLWYVADNPLKVDLPPPPHKLEDICPDASYVSEDNAFALAAEFGADIGPAPPEYQVVTGGMEHGGDNISEEGQPSSVKRLGLSLPNGYVPVRARVLGTVLTDEIPRSSSRSGTSEWSGSRPPNPATPPTISATRRASSFRSTRAISCRVNPSSASRSSLMRPTPMRSRSWSGSNAPPISSMNGASPPTRRFAPPMRIACANIRKRSNGLPPRLRQRPNAPTSYPSGRRRQSTSPPSLPSSRSTASPC